MLSSPYNVRAIDLDFQLGEGSFGASGMTQLSLKGLRVAVQIENAAAPSTNPATIRVYGLSLDQLNELSQAGLAWRVRRNLVFVSAGDAKAGMSKIFQGTIIEAYPDFTEAPNSSLSIFATFASGIQLKPVPPSSYPASAKASEIMSELAQKAGLSFENNGVDAVMASPYLPGTVWQQMESVARAGNFFYGVDSASNILAIWPKNGNRSGQISVISPENGMIGYPTFQNRQISIRTLFDPHLSPRSAGSQIQVNSQLKAANGKWNIIKIDYNLTSQMPNGPWEMMIHATPAQSGGGTSGAAS